MGDGDFGHQQDRERGRGVTSPALRFARAISARHRTGRLPAAPVPRVGLRLAMALAPARPVRLDVRIAQRLAVRVGRTLATTPRAVALTPYRGPGEAAIRLVERIVAASVRSDDDAARRIAGAAPLVPAPAVPREAVAARTLPSPVPPVRRIVRTGQAATAAGGPARPPSPSLGPLPAAPAAVLGAAELQRVTSHVVETLDRRVSAWRERTGRV